MISIKDNKIRWAISAVLALLILFGTYRNVFSLAAFLICGLMLAFCDRETNLLQIFFIMPMANIFKLSPGVQSFFTIILLVYVVLHLVLPRKATLIVALFAVYVLIGQLFAGEFNLFRSIKLICNLLFLSSTLNDKVSIRYREIFMSYIIGNVVSSVFGMLDSSFFKIESYIGIKELGTLEGIEDGIKRFAGLYADPNYYAIGPIICICLIVILIHKEKINYFLGSGCTALLVYFLIQTYSKSAVLMLFVPFFFLVYSLLIKKKYIAVMISVLAAAVAVYLALSGKIPALEIVLKRLSDIDGSNIDLNQATTGRFNLWVTYFEHILNNIRVGVFGEGVAASHINGRASHNTYLDILYHLGTVGGVLLLLSLGRISAQSIRVAPKRNIMNYSVLICILIMYFFLGELFYFDPPFQIFIAFMVLNMPLERSIGKQKKIDRTEDEHMHINTEKVVGYVE